MTKEKSTVNTKTDDVPIDNNSVNHKEHHHEHSGDEGHDHSHEFGNQSKMQLFAPAVVSFVLLLVGIALDYFLRPEWFTENVRLVWYSIAYVPVGLPVLKEAWTSIKQGDIFSEFFLMGIATVGAFAIGEFPEGVAVMLFYAIGEIFQTLAVTRAKTNIKTLLDQRPDEATILIDGRQIKTKRTDYAVY